MPNSATSITVAVAIRMVHTGRLLKLILAPAKARGREVRMYVDSAAAFDV